MQPPPLLGFKITLKKKYCINLKQRYDVSREGDEGVEGGEGGEVEGGNEDGEMKRVGGGRSDPRSRYQGVGYSDGCVVFLQF